MPNHLRNDIYVQNSVIDILMKFGDINGAEKLFRMIKNKSIVTYDAMMNGYNINQQPLSCLNPFQEMKEHDIVPNAIVFTALIDACARLGTHS